MHNGINSLAERFQSRQIAQVADNNLAKPLDRRRLLRSLYHQTQAIAIVRMLRKEGAYAPAGAGYQHTSRLR